MRQYKVGLVGIGAVGTEMIKVLRQRKFPCSEIRVLATRDRDEEIAGETFHVQATTPEAFDGLDIVLFAGTEGAKGASKQWGWEAVKRGAIIELQEQLKMLAAGETPTEFKAFPYQIACNVIPQIGGGKPQMEGYTSEEAKMTFESRKILGVPDLRVSTTCVRVPVFYAHSVAVHAEFSAPMPPARAREILSNTVGIRVVDDLDGKKYPMPLFVGGGDEVQVGRIRVDPSVENGLALFCCGDNIRKGAAQNAVQIAEKMIERGLI